jgi:LacI family transcriptional regulator
MPSPPTLKDLARKLGLSIPTVSLGLRHAGNVSEATCQRITEAAKKMGYRPNPHAAALSSGVRTKGKGRVPLAILRMPLKAGHTPYPIEELVQGIIRRTAELGYKAETFDLENPAGLARLLKVLYNRGVQGIFLPPVGTAFRVGDYNWSQFSILACGRYDQKSPFHTVRAEIFETTRELLNEVIVRGYRRICLGLLKHDPPLLDDYARIAAAGVCQPPGGKKIKVMLSPLDTNLSSLLPVLKSEKIDAAVGFGIGHYYRLKEAGVDGIAFATLHGSRDKWGKDITGWVPRDEYLGVVAANRMDAMIRHHERGVPEIPEQIVISGEWQEGVTLPFRRQS